MCGVVWPKSVNYAVSTRLVYDWINFKMEVAFFWQIPRFTFKEPNKALVLVLVLQASIPHAIQVIKQYI